MLQVHRAERGDLLADCLGDVLREPLEDPFAVEVVSVPAKGVERWLSQRLSHRLGGGPNGGGVCANVAFPAVSAVIEEAVAAGGGFERVTDPWQPSRLVWTLLDVIDQCAAEPWCSPLGAHLGVQDGDQVRRGRRYATARRLAELFDSYGLHRPDMVTAWSCGEDVDGLGNSLPVDLRWQAELWRRLCKQMPAPSPAERLAEVCQVLREHPERSGLPPRLSIFGPTRLPAMHVAVLAAVAERREVHLWLAHPSPVLWDRVRPYAVPRGPLPRHADPTRELAGHPLLVSLGRDARELQLALAAVGVPTTHHHHQAPARPDTLLGRMQRALALDDEPDRTDPPLLDPADRSVQVHACHGADRQVEVLREVVLGLLAEHPDLEPRDVLVMCPDIETFAPLISASFGLGDEDSEHPGHRMRVRLADRALRQVNPMLDVVAHLLELADSRLTAAQVLDFVAAPPVRRRFRLDDDDLERLRDLVARSGVRWGLDAEHRSRFQLGGIRANTWAAGLDRIMLGVAMSEDDQVCVDTALPLDDVDSSDADLAGRLAEILDRLGAALVALSGEHTLTTWLDMITAGLDSLTAVADSDDWQRSQVGVELADVAAAAAGHAVGVQLSLSDVRSLLGERLRGRPTRANFRTGELTVCTMVPMRSVPHRVVCLLGLDDGVFPRTTVAGGDDVLARDPCVGERDPRSEDRQLLLDAVLAATQYLVLVYSGADERTNARRPPAVPLEELLDTVDATVRTGDGSRAREQVLVRHPLQTFGPQNFSPGVLGVPRPFSFDRAALAGAKAAGEVRDDQRLFLPAPLPRLDHDVVELDDLRKFLEHPVRAFLRRRLGVTFFSEDEDPVDGLPVELDALETWAVGDRLLRTRLTGADLGRCIQAEWRRGTVPPGALGLRLLDKVAAEVEPLVAAAGSSLTGEPVIIDVHASLPGGRAVVGTLSGVYADIIATVEYARLGPKHRLRAWVRLLTLTASQGDVGWRAVTIGRDHNGRVSRSTLGPVDPGTATALLTGLVDLSDEGLCEPLPLFTKASHAYARCRTRGGEVDDAVAAARKEWTRFGPGGESDDPAHAMVWGSAAPLDTLLTEDAVTDRASAEPTRFGALAMRLWAPLLDAETVNRL